MTVHMDRHGNVVQASRPAVVQNIAVGAGSVQSVAFQTGGPTNVYNPDGTVNANVPNDTTHIRVVSTVNCWIAFGASPTAVVATGSILIPAYTPEYFFINRGERIAVIQDATGGTLNVAELAQ